MQEKNFESCAELETSIQVCRYRQLVRVLCPDIFQFHCACLRTEICLRELTFSRTLNPNPKSSRSVDPQFSHKVLFYVH